MAIVLMCAEGVGAGPGVFVAYCVGVFCGYGYGAVGEGESGFLGPLGRGGRISGGGKKGEGKVTTV